MGTSERSGQETGARIQENTTFAVLLAPEF
jgi:hypothetical protein